MSADIFELLGELRELALDLRHRSEETGYGIFPGGDPNTFTPDPEASTPEEQDRWKRDCILWKRGKREGLTRTACEVEASADGAPVVLLTPSGYGFGVYTIEDPQAADDAEKLESVCSRLEAWLASRADSDLEDT